MHLCIDGWKGTGQMTGFLFRGLLIGILFGVPAGTAGAMAAQRTFRYGVRAGILTGGINLLKKKAKQFSFSRMNAVSGMILLLLGVSVLAGLLS